MKVYITNPDLIIKEENFTTRKIKEFSKDSFSYKRSSTSEAQIDYTNLLHFILKLSGIEFPKNYAPTTFTEENFHDEDLLDEIINKASVKKYKKIKAGKMYSMFEVITEDIYNKYKYLNLVLKSRIRKTTKLLTSCYSICYNFQKIIIAN